MELRDNQDQRAPTVQMARLEPMEIQEPPGLLDLLDNRENVVYVRSTVQSMEVSSLKMELDVNFVAYNQETKHILTRRINVHRLGLTHYW
ncbi:unnamed protein product [Strongylus vulgaris]|uniref:Uncharacterized protein n=1 Tax=Strongylus vulgaris TaxID=40348 RepID=A0A3P7IIQ1_STRVU|nr:unnamed protein product [Strongylus vulgaris]